MPQYDDENYNDKQIIQGVVTAVVSKRDVKNGKVKVIFYGESKEKKESNWIPVVMPKVGNKYGVFFLPYVNDVVVVAFYAGMMSKPFVIGSLWDREDKREPPYEAIKGKKDEETDIFYIRTRYGHSITLYDGDKGKGKIEIKDERGKNKITINSEKNSITIDAGKDIVLNAPNGNIKMNAKEVEINSSGKATVKGSKGVAVNGGSGGVKVKGTKVELG